MTLGPEAALGIGMRIFGVVSLCALPFVFVPRAWMGRIHSRSLRMGALPSAPIVGYLARSTSALYAIVGGLMLSMAGDLERYRPVIGYLLVSVVVFGFVLLFIDIVEGLPRWWILGEGPLVIVVAGALLRQWWKLGR